MKAVLERKDFAKALSLVTKVVEKRVTIPILENVKLGFDMGLLRLTATDLDIEISTCAQVAEAEISEGITVHAGVLSDIVRKLPDGAQVQIRTDGSEVLVQSGRSRFKLHTLPVEDYPSIDPKTTNHKFVIQMSALAGLIDTTSFAISTEETRYYLNGVYLHAITGDEGSRLIAVATDGHRLAKTALDLPDGAEGIPSVIVPRKTVLQIAHIYKEIGDQSTTVEISDSMIRLSFGTTVLTSKLIDGTFPDYGRVIPTDNPNRAIFDRKEIAGAVDRISYVGTERGRAAKISLSSEGCTLSAMSEIGAAEDQVAVEYSGDPVEIGFNSRYLLDILNVLDCKQVAIDLADPGSPALIRNFDIVPFDDPVIVLMPMRV